MTAKMLDGKKLANTIKTQLKADISQLATQPGLDVILVGDDEASQVYVGHKQKSCEQVGIRSRCHRLSTNTTQTELEQLIDQLNADDSVHGILLQLPLPSGLDCKPLLERIASHKDVDCFHPFNIGRLVIRQPWLRPCTPYGIIQLLDAANIDISGLDAVVVGASNIVGRPMALELLLKEATVTVCHSKTKNLKAHVSRAELLIAATGNRNVIDSHWIKPGAVVVDVGIHRNTDNKLVGDVDFNVACKLASYLTPVPGGVGPMTVATLLQNTLLSYQSNP